MKRQVQYPTKRFLLIIFGIFCCTACSSQLYPGSARPDEEVSTICFRAEPGIRLFSRMIDSQPLSLFSSCAKVMPGKHEISLNYQVDITQCNSGALPCPRDVNSGNCKTAFQSRPGAEYLAMLNILSGRVVMCLSHKGYFDLSERSEDISSENSCR